MSNDCDLLTLFSSDLNSNHPSLPHYHPPKSCIGTGLLVSEMGLGMSAEQEQVDDRKGTDPVGDPESSYMDRLTSGEGWRDGYGEYIPSTDTGMLQLRICVVCGSFFFFKRNGWIRLGQLLIQLACRLRSGAALSVRN